MVLQLFKSSGIFLDCLLLKVMARLSFKMLGTIYPMAKQSTPEDLNLKKIFINSKK